jgi:hypothetical protein
VALQTTAVARKWLSSDHVVTPTDTNTTIALQQRNGVYYVALPRCYKRGQLAVKGVGVRQSNKVMNPVGLGTKNTVLARASINLAVRGVEDESGVG